MQKGGSPRELYDQVKDGVVDIGWIAAEYMPEHFPAFEVFQLPHPASSAAGASRALWHYVRLNDFARKEFDGLHVLAVGQHDAPQFHLRSRQVQSLADLKGLRIATLVGPARTAVTALGATAVEMPPGEIAGALSKGTVDGTLLPWAAVTVLGVDKAVKYHAELGSKSPWLYSGVFVLAMNKATYKSLSDDLRKVIATNSGAETSARLGKIFDDAAASARKLAIERGDVVNTLPIEEGAKWQVLTQKMIDEWIAELDKRGLHGRALLESARTCLADYDAPK
jgi:TRAP-type C4-dicarboxylate transport system substrate-binding protein